MYSVFGIQGPDLTDRKITVKWKVGEFECMNMPVMYFFSYDSRSDNRYTEIDDKFLTVPRNDH